MVAKMAKKNIYVVKNGIIHWCKSTVWEGKVMYTGQVSVGCVGLGLGAALHEVPEDSEGLGWCFLPVGSCVFTSVRAIAVIRTPLTNLLMGQFRVIGLSTLSALSANGYFGSRSCLLDSQIFRSQHFLFFVFRNINCSSWWRSLCVCVCFGVCVCGWLKAGWGVSSQMLGLQLAGWVGGELHWKAAVPAKWGLARHWEEIIHISSASSSSSQPPAETQHKPRAWIVYDTEIKIEKQHRLSGDPLSNPTP